MTAVDPAVPVSEPGAKEVAEAAIEDVPWDHRADDVERACIAGEWMWARRCDCGWHGLSETHFAHVASVLAAHTPEGAEGVREVPCSGGCGTSIRVVTLSDGSKGALMTCDGDGCPGNIQRYWPPAEPDAGDVEALAKALREMVDKMPETAEWAAHISRVAAATADRARRDGAVEAGERIAQAIEAHPSPYLTRINAARIARADRLETP